MQKAAPQSSTCRTMILVSKVMPYTVYLYYPVVSTLCNKTDSSELFIHSVYFKSQLMVGLNKVFHCMCTVATEKSC